MGSSFSSEGANHQENKNTIIESLTKEEVIQLFRARCYGLLKASEINTLTSRLNIVNVKESSSLTCGDFSFLLGLTNGKELSSNPNEKKFHDALKLLYESIKVLGHLPFLKDYLDSEQEGLRLPNLVVGLMFYLRRLNRLAPDMDYLAILYISLSLPGMKEGMKKGENEKREEDCKTAALEEEYFTGSKETIDMKLLKNQVEEDSIEQKANRILWSSLGNIKNFDGIDIKSLELRASDLHSIITLLLLITSFCNVPDSKYILEDMVDKWTQFATCALNIVRFFNVDINEKDIHYKRISFSEFLSGVSDGLSYLFYIPLPNLIRYSLLCSLKVGKSKINSNQQENKTIRFREFKGSYLVNESMIAYLGVILKSLKSECQVTKHNLIKLYDNTESGYSIRLLESKIFKWRAPTIMLVSGKRLKKKTMRINKRYHKFDAEFPHYFKSQDDKRNLWQHDNEVITYAILVAQPWRNSNKRNFGDENTLIVQVSPRLDFYRSIKNPSLNGESIYLNTLGCGIGFGNNQPLYKNSQRKYFPGDVSLTVESNLEFAVFRHLSKPTGKLSSFFEKSKQHQVNDQDFEDRFMITNVEVWGLGSTKELEEQKRRWEWEEQQAEASRSINMKKLGEDRAFLEMVGLVGDHNASGGSV